MKKMNKLNLVKNEIKYDEVDVSVRSIRGIAF